MSDVLTIGKTHVVLDCRHGVNHSSAMSSAVRPSCGARIADAIMRVTKAVLVAALFGAPWLTPCARADVSVKVSADAVELNAHDATVEDVLASLEAARDLRHRTQISLDRTISGTYKGTLRSVISGVLAGYDFVLKDSQDRLEVTILGLSGTKGQISPQTDRPQPAPSQDADTQPAATSESIANNELTVPQTPSVPAVAASSTKPSAVDSMLLNAAQASSGPPAPAASSATNAGAVPSMPSPAAIAALTQKAAAQLDALLTSLQRLQP
jgi:hypothetical protein